MAASRSNKRKPAAGSGGGSGRPAPVRSLRIGIILGGKIIEEKLLRPGQDEQSWTDRILSSGPKPGEISIGQSAKNTFSVPVESLPRTWPLFQRTDKHYVLNFTEKMDGRISDGGDIYTFDQLRAGPAKKSGNGYQLELGKSSRGKITLGELTVLFQFVKAPPIQPRPQLPASVRGSLSDRIDPVLAVILLLSLAFHGGSAWYLFNRDVAARTKLELISRSQNLEPERTAELFQIPQRPDPVETTTDGDGDATTETDQGSEEPEKDPKPKPDKPKRGNDDDGGGRGGPPSDAAIDEAIESSAAISVLTGGAGGAGSRYSDISGKDAAADLDKSLRNVARGGGKVTSRGSGGLAGGVRGPQSGEIGAGTGSGVGGPKDQGRVGGSKAETKIASRTSVGGVDDFDDTSLDPNAVASTIRKRYLKGIKRCHEDALKVDPKSGGRVDIEITVGKLGRVVSARVDGFDSGVDACIKRLALKWRFAVPKDDGGAPTEATFAMPFVLKPGA